MSNTRNALATLILIGGLSAPVYAEQRDINIPTRYGNATFVDIEGAGSINYKGEKIGYEIFVTLDRVRLLGVFQQGDADIALIGQFAPKGGNLYIHAIRFGPNTMQKIGAIESNEGVALVDSISSDEIILYLGKLNGQQLVAKIGNKSIALSTDGKNTSTLPKNECAVILNQIAECSKYEQCDLEWPLPMAAFRIISNISNKYGVFSVSDFNEVCFRACKSQRYILSETRRRLCKY